MRLEAKIVAEGWLDLFRYEVGSYDYKIGSWSFDILMSVVDFDGQYTWDIICEVLKADKGGRYHEALRVYVFEDFLINYGSLMRGEIESKLKESEDLKNLLRGSESAKTLDFFGERS